MIWHLIHLSFDIHTPMYITGEETVDVVDENPCLAPNKSKLLWICKQLYLLSIIFSFSLAAIIYSSSDAFSVLRRKRDAMYHLKMTLKWSWWWWWWRGRWWWYLRGWGKSARWLVWETWRHLATFHFHDFTDLISIVLFWDQYISIFVFRLSVGLFSISMIFLKKTMFRIKKKTMY